LVWASGLGALGSTGALRSSVANFPTHCGASVLGAPTARSAGWCEARIRANARKQRKNERVHERQKEKRKRRVKVKRERGIGKEKK